VKAYKGNLLIYHDNPGLDSNPGAYSYFIDGILIEEDGKILYCGSRDDAPPEIKSMHIDDYSGKLITAGFTDTHIHYPQIGMIASYGEQLLEWLERYAFPMEAKFKDRVFADKMAEEFIQELFRNGTTSALVFSTVHEQSADALFSHAEKQGLSLITGKVLMDRNAPEYLIDTPERGYKESKKLIEKWHKHGRLRYAVTPRFAITSTPEQLTLAGKLLQEFPDVYMQTHLSENKKEIETVNELFSEQNGYLDVYNHFGLVGGKSVFAHCVHLSDDEFQTLKRNDSAVAFCPCSNLFLGSGLFNLDKIREYDIKMGLGTDVGGGNSFSVLQNLNEAYKVAQLRGQKLNPVQAFYYATLGGARALSLEDEIGSLHKGKFADFIVLNPNATPLMDLRLKNASTLNDILFILMMMGDDRCVEATYVAGKKVK